MKVRVALALLLCAGILLISRNPGLPAVWQDIGVPILHVMHLPLTYIREKLDRPTRGEWRELRERYAQALRRIARQEELLEACAAYRDTASAVTGAGTLSKVMAWDTSGHRHSLFIQGRFAKDSPALTPEGLIGRVTDAGLYHSRVMLITDPFSRVPVRLEGQRAQAILCGQGNGEMSLEFEDSPPGQLFGDTLLVTTGVGGIFPPDIPAAVLSYDGVARTYRALPVVKYTEADFVRIIEPETDTRAAADGGS